VYFIEFNVLMEKGAYLPLVSGILRAYAELDETVQEHYEFQPFLFLRRRPELLLDSIDAPDVVCMSTSMWNEQLNLRLAELIKDRYPECLIVMGGPHVPHHAADYFASHRFVDIGVRGEGERVFVEILKRFTDSREFSDIPNISWRNLETDECVRNDGEYPLEKDLDVYPSPYVEGLFDDLFDQYPEMDFQTIIETNRGCPFLCAFCFWGQGGLSLKFRYHSVKRIRQELEWMARKKIRYVFNADSNFGMHRRDSEIADILIELHEKHGYPEKFRTCFGKNTDERIFEIGLKLHRHGLEKGITLSRQSMNDQTLEYIDRENIKMSTYQNLQVRYNEEEIPVYTELILGLPGETHESWLSGIEELLQSGLKNQLFVYPCHVYPNTTLGDPEYIGKFGIEMRRIRLTEIHARIRPDDDIPEYEHITITTDDMTLSDWKRMTRFSWMVMMLHSLKLGYFILMYMADRYGTPHRDLIQFLSETQMPREQAPIVCGEGDFHDSVIERILDGQGRACELPDFGDLYWDVEETSVLRIAGRLDAFYDEVLGLLRIFLEERGIAYDDDELTQAVAYQRMRFPTWNAKEQTRADFSFNFPEYFERGHLGSPIPLVEADQTLMLDEPRDFGGDRMAYAREVILWGRKSDRLLERATWTGESTAPTKDALQTNPA
jgi:putative methyltransferase